MEIKVSQTSVFARWHEGLRDLRARIAIARRIDRARHGNFGDCEPVGGGVSEMRVDVGAGYRLYFVRRRRELVILLCVGTRRLSQAISGKPEKWRRDSRV